MRDLTKKNPKFTKAEYFVSFSALIPLAMSGIGLALASGAAPDVALLRNPVGIFCVAIMVFSLLMLGLPKILSWQWRAEHFGMSIICLGAVLLMGGVPWLCFLAFSTLPLYIRIFLFSSYVAALLMWSRPFVVYYRLAFQEEAKRTQIYQIDGDACYFLAKGDKRLFEKQELAAHFPPSWVFVLFIIAACCAVAARSSVVPMLGIPIVHIFLGIMAIPLDMMALTFLIRGALIYFYYPRRIFLQTGARVYVDMDTSPTATRNQAKK